MENLSVSWGETLPFVVQIDDTAAETATITISDTDGNIMLSKSGNFVVDDDTNLTDISLNADETEMPLGEYNYQLRIDYTGGRVDKFPDADYCDGCDESSDDFSFPKIIILPSLDGGPGVIS